MKKILLFFFLSLFFTNCLGFEDTVKSNIKGGVYDSFLEVYLNDKNPKAKIFYYTDGIGRFDNLIEFDSKNPIIITKDTTLNFFSILNEFESTKIKEETYIFKYKKDLEIFLKDDFLYIKNNSKDILNLGFWEIKGDNYSKIIQKNTFIKANEELKIEKLKNINNLQLISPDKKIIINQTILEKIEVIENIKNTNHQQIEIIDKNQTIQELQPDIQNDEIENNNGKKEEKIQENTNNIKASILDTKTNLKEDNKQNNFYFFIIIFVIFTFFITLYNIYTIIKASKQYKKTGKK